ncbi:hypothetical protein HYX10_06635 [Candidatus Woesearchaeota archaeon]|nr:hypothetical protein [Candidatus Woesearchaeota archaeon]
MLHQKRSELLRLFAIAALLAVSVGVILVYSAQVDTSGKQGSPIFVNSSINTSVNFTITVSAGSNTVRYIGINKPASYSDINCADRLPVDSAGNAFTCTEVSDTLVKYTSNDGVTAGNSVDVKINATAGAGSGNVSFTINTFEDASGTAAQNNTIVNVTVDDEAPVVKSINVTSGTLVLTNDTIANGTGRTFVAKNALVINATVTSNLAPVRSVAGGVKLFYNVSNTTVSWDNQSLALHPTGTASSISMSNKTVIDESNGLFNATIPVSDISNGSVVFFTIYASDTIGNENVTNSSSYEGVPIYTFNLTVDDAAPTASAPTVGLLNNIIDDIFDASQDNITTSSQVHNFSIDVIDHGGSGIHAVWINVSGTHTLMSLVNGNRYNASGSVDELGGEAGDANLTIYFITNDSVGNQDNALSLSLLVDDNNFTFTVTTTNLTNNYTVRNTTMVNITADIFANLNISGGNATIHGPNNRKLNMTLLETTTSWGTVGNTTGFQNIYRSRWYSSGQLPLPNVDNSTSSNTSLAELGCELQGIGDQAGDDGDTCSIQITWSDIFGRTNSSNITITVDNVAPIVVNTTVMNITDLTPGSFVTRSTAFLNFSVNAYNNIENVSLHNSTRQAEFLNVSLMNAGGATNFSVQVQPRVHCLGEGVCDINITATDQALQQNVSVAKLTLIVDDTPPGISDAANFLFGIRIGNRSAANINSSTPGDGIARNITGYEDAVFRGLTLIDGGAVVHTAAILNLTINATDTTSNITLLYAGNSSSTNFTRIAETATEGNFWRAQNSSYELCGLASTDTVEVECILTFTAKDNVSLVNASTTLTLRLDSLPPRVANLTTDLSLKHRVGGISNYINFSVNITDANLAAFNVSIANSSSMQMNRSQNLNSNATSVTYWVVTTLNDLGCSENSNCTVRVVANDSINNVNDSVAIVLLSDASGMAISNRTFGAVFNTASPLITVNTSASAQCRYSSSGVTNYSQMATQFDSEGTRHNSFTVSNLLDDDNYEYDVSCVDLDGENAVSSTAKWDVDTTSLWNITIGATGSNGVKYDYFTSANKFYTFTLPNTNVLTSTSHNNAADTYNVTNVLESVISANSAGANNNLSVLFAYDRSANTWTSYIPGRASNDFTNFTADTNDYYVNLTVANERIEIG